MNKLFGYPGGKWPIRNAIVSSFPRHTTYVDVFGGSAAIVLTKEPSDGEVFNDKNEQIANFFRVVKHRPAELAEKAQTWIHSRKLWDEVKQIASGADEIERALRFWITLQDSFGCMGKHYGTSRIGMHSVTHARKYLNEVAERLTSVHIECLDFDKCIRIYDSANAFFYCDPPYPDTKGGSTNYDLLSEDEWHKLRDTLAAIEGKFLLSCNRNKFVIDLFKSFRIKTLNVRVTLARQKGVPARREILISNYALPSVAAIMARARGDRKRIPGNNSSRVPVKVRS
jgi:DNA adenine methylase